MMKKRKNLKLKEKYFNPEYLKEEIEKLIPYCIDSVITIFYYMKENKDYIINEKGEINPVYYLNTGIVQRNMYQILQILNALRIHPESTGTN
jgi:hypothetical protein